MRCSRRLTRQPLCFRKASVASNAAELNRYAVSCCVMRNTL